MQDFALHAADRTGSRLEFSSALLTNPQREVSSSPFDVETAAADLSSSSPFDAAPEQPDQVQLCWASHSCVSCCHLHICRLRCRVMCMRLLSTLAAGPLSDMCDAQGSVLPTPARRQSRLAFGSFALATPQPEASSSLFDVGPTEAVSSPFDVSPPSSEQVWR